MPSDLAQGAGIVKRVARRFRRPWADHSDQPHLGQGGGDGGGQRIFGGA